MIDRDFSHFSHGENAPFVQNIEMERKTPSGCASFPGEARPLRRSRARFPLLSPAVTSSPGAGEVFPQRGSQDLKLVAKVLDVMRKFPALLLALPLGELAKPTGFD